LEYEFLGIKVHAFTIESLHRQIEAEIKNKQKSIIANHNLHSLYIYHKNPKMRRFFAQAKYTHIDGMSIVFLGRLLGAKLERKHRITYSDWIYPLLMEAKEKDYRVFFLGAKPEVAAKAGNILIAKIEGLKLEVAHGYFDPTPGSEENNKVLERINEYQPHILLVGMGMPRQEFWILDNYDDIKANVILTAGACLDLVAGELGTPPRWMGRIGLDWFYRLITEPRHVWKRYLIEPWFILILLCKEIFGKLNILGQANKKESE